MADSELPVLDAVEQRVLGSLLEKQITVPATYPLSLNALRTACNQTSSRDPVVDYDDRTVEEAARALKARGLVRVVWAGRGSRTLKYHQLLDERLALQPDERALISVLLLRGAQAPGELKTRTERLFSFADRGDVEACLRRLSALPAPVVRELELRPGQQDRRWIHLLGPVTEGAPAVAAAREVDREVILSQGAEARDARVLAAYDQVAEAYASSLGDRLAAQPFERWLLSRVAELTGAGSVADVGCGPGQVTAFLSESGVSVTGFDLSPGMIEQARTRHPELEFEVADFRKLLRPRTAPGWAAVTAWDAFGHLAPSELDGAVRALGRVLVPGGWLALAVPTGNSMPRVDSGREVPVDVERVLHDPHQVLRTVVQAGFPEVEWYLHGREADEGGTLFVLACRDDRT